MSKYLPIIWATIDDAIKSHAAERRGEVVMHRLNDEGYLVFVESITLQEWMRGYINISNVA